MRHGRYGDLEWTEGGTPFFWLVLLPDSNTILPFLYRTQPLICYIRIMKERRMLLFGAGFLSSWIGRVAANHGYQVECVSRRHNNIPTNLADIKTNVLVYLAAYGNYHTQTDADKCKEVNVDLLWDVMHAATFTKFIHISTSSVTLPVQTPYSRTKRIGEELVSLFKEESGLFTTSIRPFSVYGPGDSPKHFVPTVIEHLKRDGNNYSTKNKQSFTLYPGTHDWIYVEDFAKAVLLTIQKEIEGPVEVGTGIESDNSDVIAALEEASGRIISRISFAQDKGRVYDTESWVARPTKLRQYGWQPIQIKRGLKNTWDNYDIQTKNVELIRE